MEVHSELRGWDAAEFGIQATTRKLRVQMIEILGETGRIAEDLMKTNVPRQTGQLAASIELHPIQYSPGGAGGGGLWTVEVRVGAGVPHLQWVVEGTGVYGPRGGWIRPKRAKFMTFQKKGEPRRFREVVAGQKPQREWIAIALYAAEAYMKNAVAQLDLQN